MLDPDLLKKLKPLSPKARASIMADGWMTVWEGAVRSGKTVASLIAWMRYVLASPEKQFVMSGNTFASLVHNTLDGEFGLLNMCGGDLVMKKDSAGANCLFIMDKKIYLFGAHDDSDYKRIKGLTVGGWYADEAATHPESFIVEAMNRTIASTDRRLFWTLNPVVPSHYIYREFTDTWEGTPGYRRYHFTLDDNLALTKERKEELSRQYSGRFKVMNILGLRAAAEGVIYDNFDRNTMVYSRLPKNVIFEHQKYVACDYGTVNPCVFLECQMSSDGYVYVLREKRWDARKEMVQKTDEQYVSDMRDFIGPPDQADAIIIVDPSATSFITALKLEGYMVREGTNDVLPGIRRVSSLFGLNRLRIHESCTGLISELEMYIWDDKAAMRGEEKPLKTNDHAPDALRYYCMTALSVYDLMEMGITNT